MKTVAIVVSCDTKSDEAQFMKGLFEQAGVNALIVDMSVGLGLTQGYDVSREEVFQSIGIRWEDVASKSKGDLITLSLDAVRQTIVTMYEKNTIQGIISMGGVQNTTVAAHAMQALPLGFPKVLATTIASGGRTFGPVVGNRDIVVIPSISDFTGLNSVTRMIMKNAVACMVGMLELGSESLEKTDHLVVGITLMGITNTAAIAAIDEFSKHGIEAIGFHSTGVGGQILEELAEKGELDGVLDLTTHEITSEFFGGGFSYGPFKRLKRLLQTNIPVVVVPGGLDFIDYDVTKVPFSLEERKYNMHNNTLAHIKITKQEAASVGALFGRRLSLATGSPTIVLPTKGLRANTEEGGTLYDPAVDEVLINSILENCGPSVEVKVIEGNLNTEEWGRKAAKVLIEVLTREKRLGV
ncbi:MAG: Tm-1-like ATP-binding domain-containing protein [Sphaerochaeta sp.]